jgi:signal transduction histidine kinase/HAMP domain-containing protein
VTAEDKPSVTGSLQRLRIGPRLALGFVFVILLMLGMSAVLLWQLEVIRAQTAHLSSIDRKLIAVLRMHTNLVASYDRLEKLVNAEDTERMVPEAESLRSILASEAALTRDALGRLPPGARPDPTTTLTLEAIQVSMESQLQALTELASADDLAGVRLRLVNEIRPLQLMTSTLLADVSRQVEKDRSEAFASIDAADHRIVQTVSIAAVLAAALAGILGITLTRSITKPLRRLMQGSQALARGEFGHRVSLQGADELAQLGQVLNDTAGKLRELYDTLAAEKRLLEMIAKGETLPSFFDALCRCVEDTVPGCRCAVWPMERSGTRLLHAAAPSLPPGYRETFPGVLPGPGWSPAAMAAHLKQTVVVGDVVADPRWHPSGWGTLASAYGLPACWSTPVLARGVVRAVIDLYPTEPGRPTDYHAHFLDRLSNVARIAVERADTEEALRRSDATLAAAQRLTQTGSWRWRPATGELEWSRQTYRIFEIDDTVTPSMQLVGEHVHPEDRASFQRRIERQFPEERDLDYEQRLLRPDGSIRHVHVMVQPLENEMGRVVEFVGAVTDVTTRKQSLEALDRVRAELAHVARVATLGELTASIAHEVNQPLSGIMTNASTCLRLLAAAPPKLEEAAETARRTLRDSKRAAEVISRLRALFKKSTAAGEAVDINEAIREVIALTRNEVQTRRVVLRTELAGDLPPVVGDRVQLQQVVLNLILNSAEAMSDVEDRHRELVVATSREEGGQVRVAVRDSGVGLDARTAERLFEAFYTTKSGGMGMGLSIARSIVESHGGLLWAAPNQGPGATFAFTLPLERPHTKG